MSVVITGMHRSGTSMLGQWTARTGLSLGDGPQFEADSANPRGLYERRDVVAFNDGWLGDLGGSWWAPPFLSDGTWPSLDARRLETDRASLDLFGGGLTDWFVKDPRLSLLLPLWDRLCLQRLPVIVGLRQPREVALSLQVRNGTTLRRGLALWVAYNRALFKQIREREVLVLELGQTLQQPLAAGQALFAFLEGAGLQITGEAARIGASVEPRLVRQDSDRLPGSAERLAEDLDEMFAVMCGLHAVPQRNLPNPVQVPDWAAEALNELSQEWTLRVQLDRFESQGHGDALPRAGERRSLLQRLRRT